MFHELGVSRTFYNFMRNHNNITHVIITYLSTLLLILWIADGPGRAYAFGIIIIMCFDDTRRYYTIQVLNCVYGEYN